MILPSRVPLEWSRPALVAKAVTIDALKSFLIVSEKTRARHSIKDRVNSDLHHELSVLATEASL